MTDDYTILTPENVILRFHVAGMGSRFAAAVVDYLIVVFAYLVLAFGAALVNVVTDGLNLPSIVPSVLAGILLLITFLLWWGYFVLFELLWNGRSPGKRMLHIRVARTDRTPDWPINRDRPKPHAHRRHAAIYRPDRHADRFSGTAPGRSAPREPW